jgi:hypothetical protein
LSIQFFLSFALRLTMEVSAMGILTYAHIKLLLAPRHSRGIPYFIYPPIGTKVPKVCGSLKCEVLRALHAFLQSLVKSLGIRVTQNLVGKSASRFVPLLGAIGVGAYAYFDTSQVARTAMELLANDIVIENEVP